MASLILRLDIGDTIIDRSTRILREQLGLEVITAENMLYKLADVGANETVVINGHGCPTSLGNLSVSQLAALLAKGGLRGPVNIVLIACETGWGGAPYALELKVALVQSHKIMCSVSAPTRFVGVQDNASLYVGELDAGGNFAAGGQTPANKALFSTTKAF